MENRFNIDGINNTIFSIDENGNKQQINNKLLNISIDITGDNNNIIFGKNFLVLGFLNIKIVGNNNNIHIGDNVKINRNVYFLIYPQPKSVADNSNILIGDYCNFNGKDILFVLGEENTSINIGNDCLFAYSIKLSTTDNHTIYDINTNKRLNPPGDINIGDHCWICGGVTILNNTKISDNSIVATNSTVTKKFLEPNLLIAGVPAKICRINVNWDINIDNQRYF
ncbi:MAG: acyltransferase [bacterium]